MNAIRGFVQHRKRASGCWGVRSSAIRWKLAPATISLRFVSSGPERLKERGGYHFRGSCPFVTILYPHKAIGLWNGIVYVLLPRNLVPRARVHQGTELWNNQFPKTKILGLPVSRRMRGLVCVASRYKVDVDTFQKGIQYALEKLGKSNSSIKF